eukprot:UC1_evm1s108
MMIRQCGKMATAAPTLLAGAASNARHARRMLATTAAIGQAAEAEAAQQVSNNNKTMAAQPKKATKGGGGGGGSSSGSGSGGGKLKSRVGKDIVLIEGVRTPFVKAGTDFNGLLAHDLAREALKGLVKRTALDKSTIDYICMGTVIQECKTSNVAREAMLEVRK